MELKAILLLPLIGGKEDAICNGRIRGRTLDMLMVGKDIPYFPGSADLYSIFIQTVNVSRRVFCTFSQVLLLDLNCLYSILVSCEFAKSVSAHSVCCVFTVST